MIRDIQNIDDDIIRAKRIIKEKLINDPDVIEALDNQKLDPEEPDTYVNENIFDYIRIPGTTTDKKNFICFDIKQDGMIDKNNHMKSLVYIFNVYAHEDTIDTPYGISRHDLLAYLIRDIFNYSNIFGTQLTLVQNTPGIADAYWSSRSLWFKAETPAGLQRAVRTNKYEFPA